MFRSRSRSSAQALACSPGGSTGSSDAECVAAARVDPRDFAPLYERYLAPIFKYCYVRLGSSEAAEDATSEVFLKALAGLNGYRGGVFAAWLFRIAQNVVVDIYRRSRTTERLEVTSRCSDPSQTPEEATEARAEREALRTALAALSDEQRAAVELKLAGWPDVETAAALGISPAAVKMHRYRALNRLRTLLTGAGWDFKEVQDD